MRTRPLIASSAALVLAGCSSGGLVQDGASAPASRAAHARTTTFGYRPAIDPARFRARITNRYWPIAPGTTWTYRGTKDGRPQRLVAHATARTRTIMGVRALAVHETVTTGGELDERTTDWYAQDAAGNVWYFGERVRDYRHGRVVSTRGSWIAGVGGAQPGLVVQAQPRPGGGAYRQEYRAGVAEDMGRVIAVGGSETVPAATFRGVLRTLDTDRLNPSARESKYYAPGVGPVRMRSLSGPEPELLELVRFRRR